MCTHIYMNLEHRMHKLFPHKITAVHTSPQPWPRGRGLVTQMSVLTRGPNNEPLPRRLCLLLWTLICLWSLSLLLEGLEWTVGGWGDGSTSPTPSPSF